MPGTATALECAFCHEKGAFMTINSNLFVLFMLLMMIVVGVVAWRLARRKSRHPGLVTFLCVLLCLVPPFALLALLILALWRDMPAGADARQA